ncbi:MAG TPA: hypothetical protein VFC46_13100 [Humisphaera sp.]|nr:hypothetical protein [Humisphaera sp.]
MQIQVAQIVIFFAFIFRNSVREAPITAAIVESSGAMRRLRDIA